MMDTEVAYLLILLKRNLVLISVLGPMFLWKKLVSEHLYSICPAKLFTAKLCVFKTTYRINRIYLQTNLLTHYFYSGISHEICNTTTYVLFNNHSSILLVCPLPVLNLQPYD